jgi:tRNA-dihydrouridine synthase A
MMEWTDRHCRFFHRLLTRRARLYTEMITTGAVLRGDRGAAARLRSGRTSAGGAARRLRPASARRMRAHLRRSRLRRDQSQCRLPVGRVQEGRFGACLMAEPELVGDCVAAMKAAVVVPVPVKCRIGIDNQDPEESLDTLTRVVVAAGADALIVHARKAWLDGLSPREIRDIPPLDYERVLSPQARFPAPASCRSTAAIGGVEEAARHLENVDGVMMGRAAYQEPWRLLAVDPLIYSAPAPFASARQALEAFFPYVERELARGTRLHSMTRHILGTFHGVPGARAFRRHIAINAVKPGAGIAVLRDALAQVMDARADLAHIAA